MAYDKHTSIPTPTVGAIFRREKPEGTIANERAAMFAVIGEERDKRSPDDFKRWKKAFLESVNLRDQKTGNGFCVDIRPIRSPRLPNIALRWAIVHTVSGCDFILLERAGLGTAEYLCDSMGWRYSITAH